MNGSVNKNAIGWFEIYVDDMPRAKAFYEAVFERELELLVAPSAEEPLEMWHFTGNMEGYGAPGALVKMQGFLRVKIVCWCIFLVRTVLMKKVVLPSLVGK